MSFSVIIPSRNADNLRVCVQSILEHEPLLELRRIVVVDDGVPADCRLPTADWIAGDKPFIFARNVNLGIRHVLAVRPQDDVILMNDDATLETLGGFTQMADAIRGDWIGLAGIASAAIVGAVGNPNQCPVTRANLRAEPRTLAFICVYIPRIVLDSVGLLDERFTTYGWEDNDYCRRVRLANFGLFVYDGCRVEHGRLPSTFRAANGAGDIEPGRRIFQAKWGVAQW